MLTVGARTPLGPKLRLSSGYLRIWGNIPFSKLGHHPFRHKCQICQWFFFKSSSKLGPSILWSTFIEKCLEIGSSGVCETIGATQWWRIDFVVKTSTKFVHSCVSWIVSNFFRLYQIVSSCVNCVKLYKLCQVV